MNSSRPSCRGGFGVAAVLVLGGGVAAQDAPSGPEPGTLKLSFGAGYEEQFEEEIDNDGGDFSVTSNHFDVSLDMVLSTDLSMSLSYGYRNDDYDFDGPSGFGGLDPWDDIETQTIGLIFRQTVSNDWTLFGGPLVMFARDADASLSSSDTWGGVFGASYVVSRDLVVGFGVGLIDSLEDDLRFFPTIILNWRINDDLRLSTSTGSGGSGRSGIELVHSVAPDFEVALGAAYSFSRFRLDETSSVPNGVGEATGIPAWARASWQLDDNINLEVHGGMKFAGELLIDDRRGRKVIDDEYDATFFAGARIRVRF